MPKINSIAKGMIESMLAQFVSYHGFTKEEALYKICEVKEEGRVVFLIHERLKNLLDEQNKKNKPRHAKIKFKKDGELHWFLEIENDGVESFFFSRVLSLLLKKLEMQARAKTGKGERIPRQIKSNIDLLRDAVKAAIKKAGGDPEKYSPQIEFKEKAYHVSLNINGAMLSLQANRDADVVMKDIARKLPELFPGMSRMKK